MAWTVEMLNDVVDAEFEALPADMLARFRYIAQLIEEFGLESGSRTSSTCADLFGKCVWAKMGFHGLSTLPPLAGAS